MENQHRRISGYRELSQAEIDLMNKIEALGPQIESIIVEAQKHILAQRQALSDPHPFNQEEFQRLEDATPERFAALAKTDLQTGLMYLTRSIAQPTFF